MKIKSLISILFILLTFSSNAQQTALQQFENELKLKSSNVSSIRCKFTQTREISVLADAITKDGLFYYSEPGNMLLSFQDGDYIKMTASWFEMKIGGSVNSTRISTNPMLKNLSAVLSACMVGDFEKMAKSFDITVGQTQEEWHVAMTPQRGKAASKISRIILHFEKENMSLKTLRMEEKSGDYTMYSFFDKKFNAPIDSNLFNIN